MHIQKIKYTVRTFVNQCEMSTKTFILSSAGLKNVILPNKNEYLNIYLSDENIEQFKFIIGKKEIIMNRFFAEFISPRVSHMHFSDPTINSIYLDDFIFANPKYKICPFNENEDEKNSSSFEDLFSDEMIKLIKDLSHGYEVELDELNGIKLSLISLVIGNEEIYQQINKLYPLIINENEGDQDRNIEYMIERLKYFHSCFDDEQIIDFISSHFYKIDQNKLLTLPKSVLYSIISNSKLIIESENSLYQFINKLFLNINSEKEKLEKDKYNNIILFYENVEFSQLDENIFSQFISQFDFTEMTNLLWKKLCKCFSFDSSSLSSNIQPSSEVRLKRYFKSHKYQEFLYDSYFDNQFNGIIHHLTEICHGNVHHKGIVSVTASSFLNYLHFPKCVVNLDDNKHYYQSTFDDKDAWICYDFKEFKVHPTHYAIRSRYDASDVNGSPCNWCIEGSNDNQSWEILDTRKKETSLKYANASNVFEIQKKLAKDEFYRYLRIHQTGPNTAENSYFTLSALEYFGAFI